MLAASSSIAATLGLTRPRKRTTPVLESQPTPTTPGQLPLPSPSSVYSPEDVDGYEDTGRDVTGGGWPATPGIRMVEPEDAVAATPTGTQSLARVATIDSADRAYLGRSISYRAPAAPTAPAITALPFYALGLPSFLASLPAHLQPFPPPAPAPAPAPAPPARAPSCVPSERSTNISFAGSSSAGTASSAMARTSSSISSASSHAKTYVTRLLARSKTLATLSSSGSQRSVQTVASARYTDKFPDRWMSLRRERREKSESVHDRDEDRLPDLGILWEQAGRRGGAAGLEDDEGESWSDRKSWTWQKWCLLASVFLFCYGMTGVVLSILTWFRTWPRADVVLVANANVLLYVTLASIFCIITSLIGLVGALLDSRPILAAYAILLWPCGFMLLAIGYSSYKKEALSLDLKLNQAWSQFYDDEARLRLQDSLRCCGYYSPFHEATFSKQCYPRTSLPGCKGKLFRFERGFLRKAYRASFGIAPLHIINIFISMICSNHVNRTFGKGLMPRPYRLTATDVKENALSVLRSMPSPPTSRRAESVRSVVMTLMPTAAPGSGLIGLGVHQPTFGGPIEVHPDHGLPAGEGGARDRARE